MLTDLDVRELIKYTAANPVFSLYLNTEPTEGNADAYRLRLRNLLKSVNSPADVSAVEHYFSSDYDWTGKSVAVFSNASANFFKAYPLALPVRSQVQMGDRFSVKPLVDLLDNFGGYGVLLVDKQGARAFFFHLGELREQEGVLGEAIRHTKMGGASALGRRGGTNGQTHFEEEQIDRNMKDSADFATRFFEENHVRRVVLGGTEANIAKFRALLPKAWQSLVMGTFAMSMNASHAQVLERTLQIGAEAERAREAHQVGALITRAAKQNLAVIGLGDTLDAIHSGRVQELLLLEGYHVPGWHCSSCGQLSARTAASCTGCGRPIDLVEDVVDLAVSDVMRRGGMVDVVYANSDFEKAGSIGALLRF